MPKGCDPHGSIHSKGKAGQEGPPGAGCPGPRNLALSPGAEKSGKQKALRPQEKRPCLEKGFRHGRFRLSKRSPRAAFFFDKVKTGEEDAKERSGTAASHSDAVYRYAGTRGTFTAEVRRSNDFGRIYELVEDLYCEDNGRPSCDPVVLFKLVLIQHLPGIRSLRQTIRDAEVKVAY
jgi:hypothetical protein